MIEKINKRIVITGHPEEPVSTGNYSQACAFVNEVAKKVDECITAINEQEIANVKAEMNKPTKRMTRKEVLYKLFPIFRTTEISFLALNASHFGYEGSDDLGQRLARCNDVRE